MPRARSSAKTNSTANLGFEAEHWLTAPHFSFRLSTFDLSQVPPFNDSDWFRTAMREAQNPKQGRLTCRVWEDKDDDVRWQWREATWTTNGSPKGEWSELGSRDIDGRAERPSERARTSQQNQAHKYPSPQRGNANFAWVQHFIHHLAPHGMAGFVLARFCFWFWLKHGYHRARPREKTGCAWRVFNEACGRHRLARSRFMIAMSSHLSVANEMQVASNLLISHH